MADRDRRGVGERIVAYCLGALACAVCLTLAVDLLRSIWPWLLSAVVIGCGSMLYRWWYHRW